MVISTVLPPPPEVAVLVPFLGVDELDIGVDEHSDHGGAADTWLGPSLHLTRAADARDVLEARALGAGAALLPEHIGRSWADLEPLLAQAWAVRHDGICSPRHDWRLTFHAVRRGWHEARATSRPGSAGPGASAP